MNYFYKLLYYQTDYKNGKPLMKNVQTI